MLALVIFSVVLGGLLFVVEPNALLCASSISSGVIPSAPHPIFALSLIALFFALRSRGGFVLLVPSVVSAAMSPEVAASVLVASGVLAVRHHVQWTPFVATAAAMILMILVGVPLALFVMLALLVPLTSNITSSVWRVRVVALWFVGAFALVVFLGWYLSLFRFDLLSLGFSAIPVIVFAALGSYSALTLARDEHARLMRALFLFVSAFVIPEAGFFAMPVIIAVLGLELARSLGEEKLRGSRIVAILLVVVGLLLAPGPAEVREFDDALVFAPDHLALACEGRAIPSVVRPGELAWFASLSDPDTVVGHLEEHSIRVVVFEPSFDEPIVFALRHAEGVVFSSEDGLIVASLP